MVGYPVGRWQQKQPQEGTDGSTLRTAAGGKKESSGRYYIFQFFLCKYYESHTHSFRIVLQSLLLHKHNTIHHQTDLESTPGRGREHRRTRRSNVKERHEEQKDGLTTWTDKGKSSLLYTRHETIQHCRWRATKCPTRHTRHERRWAERFQESCLIMTDDMTVWPKDSRVKEDCKRKERKVCNNNTKIKPCLLLIILKTLYDHCNIQHWKTSFVQRLIFSQTRAQQEVDGEECCWTESLFE